MPCLRAKKKVSAASATLLPALWVDIDGPAEHRQRDLERLQAFDPAPSAIVDSGGGWHAYWLLDEPLALDDKQKQKISRILRGLFSALDGGLYQIRRVRDAAARQHQNQTRS